MTISLKIQRKQPIVFLLVLFSAILVSAEIVAHPPCGDFLKLHNKKPKYLEFIQCKKTQNAQIPTLQAAYRVKGKYASEVEKYLINMFGMQPLKFVCCIWESVPNQKGERYGHYKNLHYKNDSESYYTVSMGTENTLHSEREDWYKIDWFYVTVELLLESP
ncbi:DUF4952 domain-containing protein [Leptospira kirschneri]|uniref:DUF4952 domain-containing protein n=1 Tax=Leptospira kirschneri TaxID=29507 RepID=UPI000278443E|nr:DUF4952 domain-containing protein [Leptospira kirschneri]EJO68032.1 hypothetical protein LEP1GSC044_1319 [Leptospira kirschneri serovar Grippotyphosa str. RM52]WBF95218.1 DUF4952 domain-containing protein [Leptospira kirschneri]